MHDACMYGSHAHTHWVRALPEGVLQPTQLIGLGRSGLTGVQERGHAFTHLGGHLLDRLTNDLVRDVLGGALHTATPRGLHLCRSLRHH